MSEDRATRRCVPVLVAAGSIAVVAAPAAAAAPGCSVPTQSSWQSCLTAGHRAVLGTNKVRLTRATPVLVVRDGIARYRTNLRPDVDLRAGTVIRSFWSRLADEDRAPSVKLKVG